MAFVISGHKSGDRVVATRLQRESAVALATRLREEGYSSVAIGENGGLPIGLIEYQRRCLMLGRAVGKVG